MSLNDFEIERKLGEGAYSSVYLVRRMQDKMEYALKKVKIMNLSEKEKENALNEIRILASISHPNVVQYKEAFLEESNQQLCIIMDYNDDGDLYQRIVEQQKKSQLIIEEEIWSVFIQVTQGLKQLHSMKIFHRDLKSANVFLNKNLTAKLGDMNVSKVAKKGLLFTQTGTPYYASPEVWKEKPYDNKSDIWSLGCVLYEMTTLKPPFRAEDMEGLYKKVCRGLYPKIPSSYSQDLNNVIRCLLQVNPSLRPSASQILQLPAVVSKLSSSQNPQQLLHYQYQQEQLGESSYNQQLLNTICIPRKMNTLQGLMPKPNYKSQSLTTPKTTQQFKNNLQILSKNNPLDNNNKKITNTNNTLHNENSRKNSSELIILKERNISHEINNHKNDDIMSQILQIEQQKPFPKLQSINDKNMYQLDNIQQKQNLDQISKKQRIKLQYNKQKYQKYYKEQKSQQKLRNDINSEILQEIQHIQPIQVRKQKGNNASNKNLPPISIGNVNSNNSNDINYLSKNSLIINNKQYTNLQT